MGWYTTWGHPNRIFQKSPLPKSLAITGLSPTCIALFQSIYHGNQEKQQTLPCHLENNKPYLHRPHSPYTAISITFSNKKQTFWTVAVLPIASRAGSSGKNPPHYTHFPFKAGEKYTLIIKNVQGNAQQITYWTAVVLLCYTYLVVRCGFWVWKTQGEMEIYVTKYPWTWTQIAEHAQWNSLFINITYYL